MARLSLEGRIALVTGADGWMRRGHARLLAERDAAVLVHDIKEEIEETTAMVRAKGRRAEAIKADVRDTEAIFGFTKSWAHELAQHRITVNAVAPVVPQNLVGCGNSGISAHCWLPSAACKRSPCFSSPSSARSS